jgi:hypothetical protein
MMMFVDFILNDELFLKSFKNLEPKVLDFDFFQKVKTVIKK